MCFECAIYWGNVGIAGKGEKKKVFTIIWTRSAGRIKKPNGPYVARGRSLPMSGLGSLSEYVVVVVVERHYVNLSRCNKTTKSKN